MCVMSWPGAWKSFLAACQSQPCGMASQGVVAELLGVLAKLQRVAGSDAVLLCCRVESTPPTQVSALA